ncbi:MAG: SMP-30/gluconolactonase/LRE family protein [Bacteroidota bacterium]
MRSLKIIGIPLLLAITLFVGYILVSTGFFRTVEHQFDGKLLKKVAIKGAEDITISSSDSFALISSTERRVYPPQEKEKGGVYLIDIASEDFTPISLTSNFEQDFAPHGISLFKKDSTYQVMVVNHTQQGHSIEVFELDGQQMKHQRTLTHPALVHPNDLIQVDNNRFYFTNDHKYTEGIGRLVEEYSGLAISNVMYFDGKDYREIANGIAYANGINYDRTRNLMYVASPRHFLVKVYDVEADGSLSFIEDIPCGTGVDNIELDDAGHLWIGGHPNLLRFGAYSKAKKETAPSEIIKITYRAKGDYSVESIYTDDGTEMSGASAAAVLGNLIFAGNVMDDEFLILESN